jgi:type IV pilus assembly protein PilA
VGGGRTLVHFSLHRVIRDSLRGRIDKPNAGKGKLVARRGRKVRDLDERQLGRRQTPRRAIVTFSFLRGTQGKCEDYLAGARLRLRQGLIRESGSTFIELLVVCLMVGVLAAIAIPAFASQTAKATNADAKVLARTAETAAEAIASDDSGSYERVTPAALNQYEPTIGIAVSATNAYVSAATGTNSEYSLTAKATGGDEFKISRSASGAVTRSCVSPVTKTGCAGAEKGSW